MGNRIASHTVAVAAVPGSPVFELAVPCEVFGIDRTDLTADWYTLLVCPTTAQTRLAAGFIAAQSSSLDELAAADTVIIPGCANIHEAAPPELIVALKLAYARGARIASICSGAFVLAEAGILDGLTATTHWMHASELAERYPRVTVDDSVLYVQQGRIWTSAGTAAGIDMCLELVRQDHGVVVADEVARRMVVPPPRGGGEAQVLSRPAQQQGEPSEQALFAWVRAHLGDDVSVADLARQSGLSHRTLIRRFRASTGLTPQQWLSQERLRVAQQLLESTDMPIDRVAARSGFGSGVNMRVQFNRQLGVTPGGYRKSFVPADKAVPIC
jgi:AraC family transcriptional regulator, transcriptional activator FtrA